MKLIAELLTLEADDEGILSGVDKLTDRAKKGFEKAKDAHKKKEAELKDAKAKAQQAEKDAKKKIDDAKKKEEAAKKYAEKEAEHAGKTAEAEHKLKSAEAMASLKDDLQDFVDAFFTRFPLAQEEDVEAMLKKYPTFEAAKEATLAFKGVGDRLEQLRDGFNKSLVKSGKVSDGTIKRHEAEAERASSDLTGKRLSEDFRAFVRGEAKFFKRLVTIKDDFKLDDLHFKELMGLKVKQTQPHQVSHAAEYVNILLMYASKKFLAHARVVYAAAKNLESEQTAAEKEMRRRATAAKAAANPDPVPEAFSNLKSMLH